MIKDKISYLIRRYRIYLERGKSIPALSLTTTTCKHCGTEYRGNYCPRCGQSHKAGSYRNKKMYKTFREAYPMLSNAFFRTIIELITRPGYMIRDYFRGHQVIYLGPVTTLVVAISCITICGHIYDEIELSSFPKKEITQPQVDSSGKTEKEIYKKWGLTITSKDDGRMDNGVVAAIWRVFREKLEDDTTLFLFAIFPMYGLAARRAFKKCKICGTSPHCQCPLHDFRLSLCASCLDSSPYTSDAILSRLDLSRNIWDEMDRIHQACSIYHLLVSSLSRSTLISACIDRRSHCLYHQLHFLHIINI